VILDYVRHIQPNPIAGLVMVDASSKADQTVLAEGVKALRGAISTELAINIEGVEKLLDVFTVKRLSGEERALMLAYNMATPAAVRAALARPADYDDVLRALDIPVLAIHGEKDAISRVAMSEHTVATCANARLVVYDGVGHLPFWEAAERFDQDVADFVETIA
jgi:pimeloyl-ACP methyl ester carboxylesterase